MPVVSGLQALEEGIRDSEGHPCRHSGPRTGVNRPLAGHTEPGPPTHLCRPLTINL